jgi:hypothetical protein
MRIAKPILSVTTPVGVAWGLVEAWRVGPWLAALMAALIAVVGSLVYMTWRRIRQEQSGGGPAVDGKANADARASAGSKRR